MPKKKTVRKNKASKRGQKINKKEQERISSNLVLFGLILVTTLGTLTTWHYLEKMSPQNYLDQSSKTGFQITGETVGRADLNKDGLIDEKDAKILKNSFQKIDNESLRADLNLDQKVDGKDYSIFSKIVESQK